MIDDDPMDPVLPRFDSQIRFDWQKVVVRMPLPSSVRDAEMRRVEHDIQRTVYELRTYVMSQHLASDTYSKSTEVPATWKDALRQEALSSRWSLVRRWAARRPVMMRTITLTVAVERMAAFPDQSMVANDPRLGPAMLWETARPFLH